MSRHPHDAPWRLQNASRVHGITVHALSTPAEGSLRHLRRHVTEMMLRKVWQSTSSQQSPIAAAIQHSVHETLCAGVKNARLGVQTHAPCHHE